MTIAVVLIINQNFNIVFECTHCLYLQIIKTVYQFTFVIFRIWFFTREYSQCMVIGPGPKTINSENT